MNNRIVCKYGRYKGNSFQSATNKIQVNQVEKILFTQTLCEEHTLSAGVELKCA